MGRSVAGVGSWIGAPERSRWPPSAYGASLSRALSNLGVCGLLLSPGTGEGFDWSRDRVVLKNGKEERGVVIESFDAEHIVLLREGNRREEIPRESIRKLDILRDRLAAFLRVRRPGLSVEADWSLVEDARRAGLGHMARLQAYHVLLRDPAHAAAHALLGHEQRGDDWSWTLDGKKVSRARFEARGSDWNHRLVLESEHFTVETDCGLRRAIDVPLDLQSLYVWFLQNLGPPLRAAEDVDDPANERMTFLVYASRSDFQQRRTDEGAYYDPSGAASPSSGALGDFNLARTFYAQGSDRPELLFELGTEAMLTGTLVLGRTRDEADDKIRKLSHWADIGLGYWVARHADGPPGYPQFRPPFRAPFQLDPETAHLSLEPLRPPHLLSRGRSELANLVGLPWIELIGDDPEAILSRARSCTFIPFLIEGQAEGLAEKGRDAVWTYFREVYCTQKAYASTAFDDGLEGGRAVEFEDAWKAWTASFVD